MKLNYQQTAEEGEGKLAGIFITMDTNTRKRNAYFAAIAVQITYAGMNLLSKAAFASGMNNYIFIFYRQTIGALFILPPTLYFEREEVRSLSVREMCKIFMLACLGRTLVLAAYGLGVNYTSATLGAAAFNCLPVTTFFFAVLLRMERVNIRKASGMAKVGGLMLCVAGVGVFAFYKGPYMKPLFNFHLLETHKSHLSPHKRWVLGCFMLLISSTSAGLWHVLQALIMKTCPSPLVLTCGQTLASVIQALVIAIAVERNPSEWKLGWNIRLIAVLYCGILVICFGNYLSCWVIKKKGPVFLTAHTPLNLIATLVGSQFLLSDGISLGSGIGGILLVLSLYSVLWGKSEEMNCGNTGNNSEPVPAEKEKIADRV